MRRQVHAVFHDPVYEFLVTGVAMILNSMHPDPLLTLDGYFGLLFAIVRFCTSRP